MGPSFVELPVWFGGVAWGIGVGDHAFASRELAALYSSGCAFSDNLLLALKAQALNLRYRAKPLNSSAAKASIPTYRASHNLLIL